MSVYGHHLRRALSLSSTLLRTSRSFCSSRETKTPECRNKFHFKGCDYNHWLIVVDFPQDHKPEHRELLQFYEQTAAKIFGSLEEAKKKIYACSTTDYVGFQVECDEQTSVKFQGVLLVLPDSYIDAEKKEYGGDKYINGHIVSKSLHLEYGLIGSQNDLKNGRSPIGPMEEGNRIDGPPMTPQQNISLPPPTNRNMEGGNKNDGPPMTPQLGFSLPPPPNRNMKRENGYNPPDSPQQNFSTPSAAQWSPSPPRLPQHFGASPPQQTPQQRYGPSPQNFSTPSPVQWSPRLQQSFGPSPPQQNYGAPYPPRQQYGSPLQNFNVPPPAQPNMDPVYTNYSPPVTLQQNLSTPSPAQSSNSSPHQNYSPHPPQQQYGPPQQNFVTPSSPQWSPPAPRLQQNFGPSPPHQNYGPHPPQQQYGTPMQNISMPPAALPNMVGMYTNYSMPVTPQQNISRPSPAQWSPSPPHPQQQYGPSQQSFNTPSPPQWSPSPPRLQQNFGTSPPHQNHGPPHPPQQQYGLSLLYQNFDPSTPQNVGPPPQQSC